MLQYQLVYYNHYIWLINLNHEIRIHILYRQTYKKLSGFWDCSRLFSMDHSINMDNMFSDVGITLHTVSYQKRLVYAATIDKSLETLRNFCC